MCTPMAKRRHPQQTSKQHLEKIEAQAHLNFSFWEEESLFLPGPSLGISHFRLPLSRTDALATHAPESARFCLTLSRRRGWCCPVRLYAGSRQVAERPAAVGTTWRGGRQQRLIQNKRQGINSSSPRLSRIWIMLSLNPFRVSVIFFSLF